MAEAIIRLRHAVLPGNATAAFSGTNLVYWALDPHIGPITRPHRQAPRDRETLCSRLHGEGCSMESRYSRIRRRAAIGRARGRRDGPLISAGPAGGDAA